MKNKIEYLDGIRLAIAFQAGANSVTNDREYLNKINVFPVPDADTGTNLASTLQGIAHDLTLEESFGAVISNIANSALTYSRGNSGIIFSQFLIGINSKLEENEKVSADEFSDAINHSVKILYDSLNNPVEGTIITVMKEWAKSFEKNTGKYADFSKLIKNSLHDAQKALENTPKQLEVLAKAGVVDSGAKGFVDFLTGIYDFIQSGNIKNMPKPEKIDTKITEHIHASINEINYRYCTEAIITNDNIDFIKLKKQLNKFGDSVVIAGSQKKLRFHIHTNEPDNLFESLRNYGNISNLKAEDMIRQFEISNEKKYPIALVTDSASDLPMTIIQDNQINVIPFTINFGETAYLDRVTLNHDRFYELLETDPNHPVTALPSPNSVKNLFSFLLTHYKQVICVHISKELSGTFDQTEKIAKEFSKNELFVVNSKSLSVSEGLIAARIAEAIKNGSTFDEIKNNVSNWISNTKIFVDIATLKYMVRGGRISPLKGMMAKSLNIKPIVSLDDDGKGIAYGKTFSRNANFKKIVSEITQLVDKKEVWNYAIGHGKNGSRAEKYAEELEKVIGKPPLYIENIGPVVGAHNGIGVVGIGLILK
ncbi:DAK2 domain-containing protein [Candidatus Neomarinimicrobiota bacterium]